ncbi:hypothetical protein ABTM77_21400, partial [Acinetobacter baumannii]
VVFDHVTAWVNENRPERTIANGPGVFSRLDCDLHVLGVVVGLSTAFVHKILKVNGHNLLFSNFLQFVTRRLGSSSVS